MPTTARQAVTQALQLMGRINAFGTVDENRQARYFGAATGYLNLLCADIARAAGSTGILPVASLDDPLPVSDDAACRVVPPGLAMYFSVLDRDSDLYSFFSTAYYGSLLPSIVADETPISDYYGVSGSPDFFS